MAPISTHPESQAGSSSYLLSYLKSRLNGDQASSTTDRLAKPWQGVIEVKYKNKTTKLYESDIKQLSLYLPWSSIS